MTQNCSIGDTRNCLSNSESSNNGTIYIEGLKGDITVQVNCSSGEDGGGDGEKLFCLLQDPELEYIPTATEEISWWVPSGWELIVILVVLTIWVCSLRRLHTVWERTLNYTQGGHAHGWDWLAAWVSARVVRRRGGREGENGRRESIWVRRDSLWGTSADKDIIEDVKV